MIDFIGQDTENHYIIAFSNFSKPMITYQEYEHYLACMEQARINADYIYLFAREHFDEKLSLEAKVKNNVKLIGMDEL